MDSLKCRYGDFSGLQVSEIKHKMRKQIFFLLVIVDPETAKEYKNVDVNAAIENVLQVYGSLNDLLGYPKEFVEVMVLLNAAHMEYQKGADEFDWKTYRKLILDAGSAVEKIKEVS
jgi:hypothetical protein